MILLELGPLAFVSSLDSWNYSHFEAMMLEQVLNRNFVLSYLDEVRGYLESVATNDEVRRLFVESRRGISEDVPQDLTLSESRVLLEYVKEAQFNETQASTGQKTFVPAMGRIKR